MSSLNARQSALEEHFAALASTRGGDRLFALEHGLEQAGRDELATLIREDCARRAPSDDHWLAWAVYATEAGYRYAGSEYWQSFEKDTPGWQQRGARGWMRDCFKRFVNAYSGVSPSGSWSDRFTIISWPIVHAILPRDLQARVAKILFDVRHAFTSETLSDPKALGQLIVARGWLDSSRLEQLADDAENIGRVALALLQTDPIDGGRPPIDVSTVSRIAKDLEGHRTAQAWLSDARAAAKRVAMRGLRPVPVRSAPSKPATPSEARRVLDALGVQPAVFLAPSADGWLVMLRPPNLAPLLVRFPELRDYLKAARPTVVGASGELLAQRRVLQGSEQIRLRSWPDKQTVLLNFENPPEVLRIVLSAECLLRPGPTWVFRIGSDKIAYELKGKAVRAGHDYVVLTTAEPPHGLDMRPEPIACAGISAYRLCLPASIDDRMAEMLHRMNLTIARSIGVRPAGLAAAGWDGSGSGEWLAGECPCVVVTADHDVQSISCRLAGNEGISIPGAMLGDGRAAFVQFPALSIGAHVAEFTLRTSEGDEERGAMEMLVRDRRHWAPGLTHDGALAVIADPAAPTLEDLWSDRLALDIHGAPGQLAEFAVQFSRGANREPIFALSLGALPVPVSRAQWRAHFRSQCRLLSDAQNAYDRADRITIDIVTSGSGRFTLDAEREFAPLRWITTYKKQYHLRLQDDRGTNTRLHFSRYAFDLPAVPQPLEDLTRESIAAEGGLYVAFADDQTQAIIVAQRQFALHELRQHIRVDAIEQTPEAIAERLSLVELWSRARQVGSYFSLYFAAPSVRALVNSVLAAFGKSPPSLDGATLQELRQAVEHEDLGRDVTEHWLEYSRLPTARRVERFERALFDAGVLARARRTPPDPHERLAEVALRLASDPAGLRAWADTRKRLHGMINLLLHNKVAVQAARLLVRTIEEQVSPAKDASLMMRPAGWEWA